MTNKEWLQHLSDRDLAKWIKGEYKVSTTSKLYYYSGAPQLGTSKSIERVIDWLNEEHKEVKF